jgi:predicted transposase YbfD/YdcC
MICGANNIEAIVNYIEAKIEWFQKRLGIEKAPSYQTIWWLLVLINPQDLHEAFSEFIKEAKQSLSLKPNQEKESIAIDGKTSRGTARAGTKALHTVSAWSSSFQLLLGQVKTDEKSNEITAIPELLKLLDLEGKIITIDAMCCQYKIAEQIVKGGGDYIFSLKGNQETIHEEVKAIFQMETSAIQLEESIEFDKGHGRIEERRARVCSDINWLKKDKKWKSINSVIEITSVREIKGKRTIEKRYYISSLKALAKKYLKWIRSHWGVESFHWTLDMAFRDDEFQGHTFHLAENFSLLQRLTLLLLKQESSLNKSIPKKRERAGWNDEYLLKVLDM